MNNPKLTRAIRKTLVYHSIFGYPLTIGEISKYLVEHAEQHPAEIENAANEDPLIVRQNQRYYFMPQKYPYLKTTSPEYSWEKITQTLKLKANVIRKNGDVLLTAISGSVAGLSATETDDIDLFLIIKPNRAWTTRAKLLTYLSLTNQRVNLSSSNNHQTPQYCLNYILENTPTSISLPNHDLFTAMEIAHLKVILDRDHTFARFLAANDWIKDILPNYWANAQTEWGILNYNHNPNRQQTHAFMTGIDRLLMSIQKKHYRAKHQKPLSLTSWETDYRPKIMQKYQIRLLDI